MFSDGSAATLLDWLLVVQAGLLLVVSPVALLHAFEASAEAWHGDGNVRTRRWLVAALVAGGLLRLAAPKSIATLFLGYRSVAQALELPVVPHYGATVFVFWRALLDTFGHDHAVILWSNALLGTLTLPLFATWVLRLVRDPGAAVVATWLAAALPLFVRNDTSDAVQVPVVLWLLAALLAWDRYLASADRRALAGALVLGALVSLARPELVVVVAVLFVGHLWISPTDAWRRDRLLGAGVTVVALLLVPHALHVVKHAFVLQGRASLPGLDPARMVHLPANLVGMNILFWPVLYPLGCTLLAAVALWRADPVSRRRLLVPVAGGLAVQAVSLVDLGWPNMARVLAPEALLVSAVAAAGIVTVFRNSSRIVRWWPALLVAASTVPTATTLFAPTNERTEEWFIRDSLAKLPDGPLVLLRVDPRDIVRDPGGRPSFTHSHFPDYQVVDHARGRIVQGLQEWMERPAFEPPVYAYLGLRCFAEYREPDDPRPTGENRLPACGRLAEAFTLEPVLELDAPNHGDVWIPYYGDAASFRLGLYKVTAARADRPGPAW